MASDPEDESLDEAKRIMERLVKTPPKPHESKGKSKAKDSPSKDEAKQRVKPGD